jgi:hypothetical protein
MLGQTFIEEYADHDDPVTVIDQKRSYSVKAPARHPIYENFRVKVCLLLFHNHLLFLNAFLVGLISMLSLYKCEMLLLVDI